MKVYLDDNLAERALAGALRKAGHTVLRPADIQLVGAPDAQHLERAIREGLVCLTKDSDDYRDLHQLVLTAGGSHFGLVVVRYDNNKKRDMKVRHIVAALGKLEQSGMSLLNQWIVLNQWR